MKKDPSGKLSGFTLIELLVVVLIIGILAAVALPQYTKAVEKSRGAQALVVLNSIAQAVQTFYMASGAYPTSFEELDVDMDSWTGNEKWCAIFASSYGVVDTRSNGEWSLQMYHSSEGALSLFMGRLNGKYKGAGFAKTLVASSGESAQGALYCAERKSNGVVFTEPMGSYCQGLWKGTRIDDDTATYRAYSMP